MMTEDVKTGFVKAKCRQCGRAGAGDILNCVRHSNRECLYEKQVITSAQARLISAGLALFGIFWTVGWIRQQGSDPSVMFGLIGVLMIGYGLYAFLGTDTRLYDREGRELVIVNTLFGVLIKQAWRSGGKLLAMEFNLSRPLPLPASVSQLQETSGWRGASTKEAMRLFRAALLSLWAEGLLQVHVVIEGSQSWSRAQVPKHKSIYILSLTKQGALGVPRGAMEQMILSELGNWDTRLDAMVWPDGPSIYELIRAVYGMDMRNPARWAVSTVIEDATVRGLGSGKLGLLQKGFAFYPHRMEEIRESAKEIDGLLSQLALSHPGFRGVIGREIERGINSRKKEDNDVSWH